MSDLIVIRDTFTGTRETLELHCGESIAANLVRLYPHGIDGPWRIYRGTVSDSTELAALDLPHEVVKPFAVYVLARGVAGSPIPFLINLAISLALNYIAKLLAPRQRAKRENEPDQTGNNALAAQGNRLRPGGRVPDIMGTVRSFPDLLCAPIESWWKRTQTLQQYFVIGVGAYDIPLATVKLGETPITDINACSFTAFDPGDVIPQMRMVRESAEVRGVSLMPEDAGAPSVSGVEFDATASTMTSDEYIAIPSDTPIGIGGTNFNDGLFWCVTAPAPDSAAPFVYVLSGPVVDETGAGPGFTVYEEVSVTTKSVHYGTGSPLAPTPTAQDARIVVSENNLMGYVVKFATSSAAYRGTVTYRQSVLVGVLPVGRMDQIVRITDPDGVTYTFAPGTDVSTVITVYIPGSETGGGGGGSTPGADVPQPTNWYTVPMENPTEIWLDIAFRQGLASYTEGIRHNGLVTVLAEFRRSGETDPSDSMEFDYSESTAGPLRFTEKIVVDDLTLAGSSPWIQVRLTKGTNYLVDDATHQYLQDTTWERLAGMRYLPATSYPDFTLAVLAMQNSRSAVSMGDSNINCIVTRKLETWTPGGGWSGTLAPTDKWADNFVRRCMAADGAHRDEVDIDLAGIYALQDELDAMDDGDQGKISMTLDQMQDIDAELAAIADVVRAVVYRVGKKLYVARDQATDTRIALFNGRTKNPDGESVAVRMANDGENDAVKVNWLDASAGYKVREYTYSTVSEPLNPFTVAAFCANWAQAWRRARYELNRIKYRREQIAVSVTEDGRICRPGDVVNITDDIANLAASAGEVLEIVDELLTLDRDVAFEVGHTYSILVRDVEGQAVDTIPVTAGAEPNQVTLSRAPVDEVTIKGRDSSTGTMYAFYDDAAAIVRPWLLTGVEASGPYVQLQGVNYNPLVFQDDTTEVDPLPPLLPP